MNLYAGLFALITGLAALAPAVRAEETMPSVWYLQCHDIPSPDQRLKCYDDIRDGYLRPHRDPRESHRQQDKTYVFVALPRIAADPLDYTQFYLSTSGDITFKDNWDPGVMHDGERAIHLNLRLLTEKSAYALHQQCYFRCHPTIYGYIQSEINGFEFYVQEASKD
jgi:hypothetical protein